MDERTYVAPAAVESRRSRRRLVLLGCLAIGVLLVGALAFALTRGTISDLSAPTFGTDDGVPADLVASQRYTATLTVAVDSDWSTVAADRQSVDIPVLGIIDVSDTQNNPQILCSGAVRPGSSVTLSCPFAAPATPGQGVRISLSVDSAATLVSGRPFNAAWEHSYNHSVR